MQLNDQYLLQIDEEYINRLKNKNDVEALANLCLKLTIDLKKARERLNQNPNNSSKPSGSCAPWDKGESKSNEKDELFTSNNDTQDENENSAPNDDTQDENENPDDNDNATNDEPEKKDADSNKNSEKKRKPGRQPGSQGFGRTQKLPITYTHHHHCESCSVCNTSLLNINKAYTGFYTVNAEFGETTSPGLQLTNTHHIYYKATCPTCGLNNRSEPGRVPADKSSKWENVGLTEWRLIGPDLAAMIVYLSMDMRITRRRVQLFMFDILGLELCVGTIQNCIIESARALAPVEEKLIEDLLKESLIYADETSHNEAGAHLWLWVFISAGTALFSIGRRTKDIFIQLMTSYDNPFTGWLMSDGYGVYRSYKKRLRCWAHLERKAKGLSESYDKASQKFGIEVVLILKQLRDAIYQAREGPDKGEISILANHQNELERLRELCEAMKKSSHEKTRELGVEFLNDWDAIFRVLSHPAWPLTNNEAERALRHWVILRRITQGTNSKQGSQALALFASVIETCRLRKSSPLLYIRDVIKLRRKGENAPDLPPIPKAA